jgi:CheY-like chemotaxis protein
LVEDDDVVRLIARAMLTALGHQTIEVASGDDAVPILASEARIDLLFTDLLMPGQLSGRQLAREACRLRPGLPIVLTSGWADSDLPEIGEVDSRLTFLLKPYSVADLQRAIANVTQMS